MTTKLDVTEDRDKYIGGSDMPVVMGISAYRSRFDLLREKALGITGDFEGNVYTEYGQTMEPIIRQHINDTLDYRFEDDTVRINDDLRYHADGYDNRGYLLEIKTTGNMRATLSEYKEYLVQLLMGMQMYEVPKGLLAVYNRPDDFSTDFDADRLQIWDVYLEEWIDLRAEMGLALANFRRDRDRLKANPLLTEEDFQPTELVELASTAIQAIRDLAELDEEVKAKKAIADDAKAKLYKAMVENGVTKWTTSDGVKVTRVASVPPSLQEVVDVDELKKQMPSVAEQFTRTVQKGGRRGYVRITL